MKLLDFHIVFYTSKLHETSHFWEKVLGCKNQFKGKHDPSLCYDFGGSKNSIVFAFRENNPKDWVKMIDHLGFSFSTKKEIDEIYEKLSKTLDIPKPIGGLNQGPYHFCVKDPNGLQLEFGTWEDCSHYKKK